MGGGGGGGGNVVSCARALAGSPGEVNKLGVF